MFKSPVVNLVILLSFVYFIVSLIISAIYESLAGGFRLRPKQIEQSIYRLLSKYRKACQLICLPISSQTMFISILEMACTSGLS